MKALVLGKIKKVEKVHNLINDTYYVEAEKQILYIRLLGFKGGRNPYDFMTLPINIHSQKALLNFLNKNNIK